MQDRARSRTRPAEAVEEEDILADGFVARIADQVFDNPAMSGGLFVMALTAAAIVSNAIMMQNGRHPDPFFMTRPTPAAPAPVPCHGSAPRGLPRPRQAPAAVPLPRLPPAPAAAGPAVSAADPRLVAEVQHALAVKKLYAGAADGIAGSRTRAAITAYEKSAGLPVTGLASCRPPGPPECAGATGRGQAGGAKSAAAVAVGAAPYRRSRRSRSCPAGGANGTSGHGRSRRRRCRCRPLPNARPSTRFPAPRRPNPPRRGRGRARGSGGSPAGERRARTRGRGTGSAARAGGCAGCRAARPAAGTRPRADRAPALPQHPERPQPGRIRAAADRRRCQRRRRQTPSEEFELDNGLPLTGRPGDRITARLVAIGAMAAN